MIILCALLALPLSVQSLPAALAAELDWPPGVLRLVSEGRFELDTPVSELLPESPIDNPGPRPWPPGGCCRCACGRSGDWSVRGRLAHGFRVGNVGKVEDPRRRQHLGISRDERRRDHSL